MGSLNKSLKSVNFPDVNWELVNTYELHFNIEPGKSQKEAKKRRADFGKKSVQIEATPEGVSLNQVKIWSNET